MIKLNDSKIASYTAKEMFNIISDIERYPEFFPWCRSVEVLERKENEWIVTLEIAEAGIQQTISIYLIKKPHEQINFLLLKGPFNEFQCEWRFESLENNQSQVSVDLSFELTNKLLNLTAGPLLKRSFAKMIDVFCEQVNQ